MKYKFIFDKEISDSFIYLSDEEKRIVLATVLGTHCAIFYGHNPERLCEAIGRLTELDIKKVDCKNLPYSREEKKSIVPQNGLLYCENFDFADEEFKSIVKESYRTLPIQVIATMTSVSDYECSLFDYFDIFYKCKNNADSIFADSVFSKGKCMEVISKAKYERSSWDSGQHTIGRENSFNHFWYKQDVWETYKNSTPSLTTRRYMKISRSLSDIDCSCCVKGSHFIEAQKYCVYDNN